MNAEEFEPCIQCGMRSYVFAELPSGREISMCLHHFAVNADSLIFQGAQIIADLRSSVR